MFATITTTRRRSTAVLAAAVLVAAGLAAAPSMGAATKPGLINCSHKLVKSPKTYNLACGDANISLTKVKWTNFGGAKAEGTATLVVNTCTPTCVAGKFRRSTVSVVASKPKTVAGKRTYSRIGLTAASGKRAGSYGVNKNGPYQLQG